ncbi:MAG TPA: hypothetical protein VGA80_17945 [Flavobacteriaceae bacterium]|jgi:hypothetical protein
MEKGWKIYNYVDHRGNNAIKIWMQSLEKNDRARLDQKIDMLSTNGPDLPPGLLSDTKLRHIKKIRLNGKVAIRLMLCKGPINNNIEFTLLYGAREQDRQLIPWDAVERAEIRRQEIINNQLRRCDHV